MKRFRNSRSYQTIGLFILGATIAVPTVGRSQTPAPVNPAVAPVELPMPTRVTVTNVRPQFAFPIASFIVGAVPPSLEGSIVITRTLGRAPANLNAGRSEIEIKVDGPVVIAATWLSDGSIEPAWKDQIWSERKFLDEGWQPLETVKISYPGTGTALPYKLLARDCKAGEKFLLRTRKYNPPLVVVPSGAFKVPVVVASTATPARASPTATAPPPVPGPQPTEVPMPNRVKVTNVRPQAAFLIEPLCRGEVPPALRGATIINRRPGKISANLDAGRSRLDITADGPVLIAATWEYDGNIDNTWKDQIWNEKRFFAEGWKLIDIVELGPADVPPFQYLLYRRECKAGEAFVIRTRKYTPPIVIVPAASTPPDKFADWEPRADLPEEKQRNLVAMKFRCLLWEKRFAELEAWCNRYLKSGDMFPSGSYKISATRRKLVMDAQYDQMPESEGLDYLTLCEEWLKAVPQSVPARLTLAQLKVAYSDWQEEWVGGTAGADIDESRRRALALLYEVEKADPTVVDAYRSIVELGRSARWSHDLLEEYRDRILANCGWSYTALTPIYIAYSDVGEGETIADRNRRIDQFLTQVVDRTRPKFGEAMYAAIVGTCRTRPIDDQVHYYGISWPRMKAGFEDWIKIFPNSSRIKQYYCLWACLYGDRPTAARMFATFTDAEADQKDIWFDYVRLGCYRAWAADDYASGEQIGLLEYPSNSIYAAHLGADGQVIIGDVDGGIGLIDRATGKLRRVSSYDNLSPVKHAAAHAFASDDRSYLIGSHYGYIGFVDLTNPDDVRPYSLASDGSSVISAVAFVPGRREFVVAYGQSFYGVYRMFSGEWKPEYNEPVRTLPMTHASPVRGLGFIDGDRTLVALTHDGYVELRNFADGTVTKSWQAMPNSNAQAMALSRDGTRLATAAWGGVVRVWSLPGGEMLAEFPKLPNTADVLAFSNDGTKLAAGEAFLRVRPSRIHLFDVASKQRVHSYVGHKAWITALQFLPDGKTLMSGSADKSVRFWKLP